MDNPTASSHEEEWRQLQHLFSGYLSGDASVVNSLFSALGRNLKGFFMARTRSEADSDDLTPRF
jgi:DNA-directed RNA polymerase specialized sigma24 family protein